MGWIWVDDHFDEHPKLSRVGPLAWGVWLAGLAYCNRNLTDGFIPWAKARTLCSFERVDDEGRVFTLGETCGMGGEDIDMNWAINVLIEGNLWGEVTREQCVIGYQVHDYGDYQESKAEAQLRREKNAAKLSSWRARNHGRNPVTDRVSNQPVTTDVTPPIPPPPPPTKRQRTSSGGATDAAFEAVWLDYPRKIGKQDALRAWRTLLAAKQEPEAITAGIRRYVAYVAAMGTEHRFVKHLSSLLGRGEGWKEDWALPAPAAPKTNGYPAHIDPISGKPYQEGQLDVAGTHRWKGGQWVPVQRLNIV